MVLIEQVFCRSNLSASFDHIIRALKASSKQAEKQGGRRPKYRGLLSQKEAILDRLMLVREVSNPSFTRRLIKIPKRVGGPKERPISLYTFDVRVILRAVLNVIWPYVEQSFIPSVSFCTFRKGGLHPPRGIRAAVTTLAEERKQGSKFVFETDIQSFFDSVNRTTLFEVIKEQLPDDSLDAHIRAILEAETSFSDDLFTRQEIDILDAGIAQGCALSPLLACAFLSPFDQSMAAQGWRMIRYVDDIVVTCSTLLECETVNDFVSNLLAESFQLQLNKDKTFIKGPSESVQFLGHIVDPSGQIKPNEKRIESLKQKIFIIVASLPKKSHSAVVQELTSCLLGFFRSTEFCNFDVEDYQKIAAFVGDALTARSLQRTRLSKGLRNSSKKWPEVFLKSLP